MSERRKRPKHPTWHAIDHPQPLAASAVPPDETQPAAAAQAAADPPEVTGYAPDIHHRSPAGSDEYAYGQEQPGLSITHSNSEQTPDEPVYLEPDLFSASTAPPTHMPGPAAPGEAPRPAGAGRAARFTPTIQARRDIVTVLVGARFDAWYDLWTQQASAEAAADDTDYFDDAVGMLEPAAAGMALAALRAHLDAHRAAYDAAGVTLLVEPSLPEGDELACMLGAVETMHEDARGRRDDGELSFVETVEQGALAVPVYRDPGSPFAHAVFAPGDPFFSAVDGSSFAEDATLAKVQAHPERYALVELQVTTLFARLALYGGADDDTVTWALTA